MYKAKLSDFQPLKHNPNKHTERGQGMLETSIEQVGYLDSMVSSEDGVILSGNARQEIAGAKLGDNVIVIETDGTIPVIHKRTDLSSDSPQAKLAVVAANRVQEVSLEWDAEELTRLQEAMDLNEFFQQWELNMITESRASVDDFIGGLPAYEQEDIKPYKSLIMHFKTEADMVAFGELIQQTINERTRFLYYPKQANESYKPYRVLDES